MKCAVGEKGHSITLTQQHHLHPIWLCMFQVTFCHLQITRCLHHRLDTFVRITDIAFNWIASCLTDRYEQVELKDSFAPEIRLQFGVPQGSVLDPLLFTTLLLSAPSCRGTRRTIHHLNAGDSELYNSFSTNHSSSGLLHLQTCGKPRYLTGCCCTS